MASEFKLEVGQDEGNASHVFYVQCGVPLDRKTLQVVGLLLDGGYGPGEIEPLADVAAVYVSVTEMQDDINVTNTTGKTPRELAGEVAILTERVKVLERERGQLAEQREFLIEGIKHAQHVIKTLEADLNRHYPGTYNGSGKLDVILARVNQPAATGGASA